MTTNKGDATPDELRWAEAPRRTEYGGGMMEALVALGKDHTLRLYAEAEALHLVGPSLAALTAPALAPVQPAEGAPWTHPHPKFGTHLSHCNFGEHAGCCKYGDDDCPALADDWRWFGDALTGASRSAPQPEPQSAEPIAAALEQAIGWIERQPHGDDCYLSDHYEGDPGNRCNCGKESILAHLDQVVAQSSPAGATLKGSEDERASWFALVMGAAASIEDAANCLRDPDAKRAADGAAKHYRRAANALYAETALKAAPVAWMYTLWFDDEAANRHVSLERLNTEVAPFGVRGQGYDQRGAIEEKPLYASPLGAPEGWRLVPVEPTEAMLDHGDGAAAAASTHVQRKLIAIAYRAMLAASPEAPHD